jgi:hypothetical protein
MAESLPTHSAINYRSMMSVITTIMMIPAVSTIVVVVPPLTIVIVPIVVVAVIIIGALGRIIYTLGSIAIASVAATVPATVIGAATTDDNVQPTVTAPLMASAMMPIARQRRRRGQCRSDSGRQRKKDFTVHLFSPSPSAVTAMLAVCPFLIELALNRRGH